MEGLAAVLLVGVSSLVDAEPFCLRRQAQLVRLRAAARNCFGAGEGSHVLPAPNIHHSSSTCLALPRTLLFFLELLMARLPSAFTVSAMESIATCVCVLQQRAALHQGGLGNRR
jgi:hypothetical protein